LAETVAPTSSGRPAAWLEPQGYRRAASAADEPPRNVFESCWSLPVTGSAKRHAKLPKLSLDLTLRPMHESRVSGGLSSLVKVSLCNRDFQYLAPVEPIVYLLSWRKRQ
jgi:hypothetical protein